jgi:hypothetical protein
VKTAILFKKSWELTLKHIIFKKLHAKQALTKPNFKKEWN